jgi:hypothetical protein
MPDASAEDCVWLGSLALLTLGAVDTRAGDAARG